MQTDSIAILDCGGQYTKVIDRRIREMSVKSEIFPISIDSAQLEDFHGIVLSGGPASVWSAEKPKYDHDLFNLDKPFLGICYGMHLINEHFGGKVKAGIKAEYGVEVLEIVTDCQLFKGLDQKQKVLMSHGDSIENLAEMFSACALSGTIIGAIKHSLRPIFGVQFHPEVDLTVNGREMLSNFVHGICGRQGNYILEDRIKTAIRQIRGKVGDHKVLVLVSGGVDSAVSAALLLRALDPARIFAVHVDHGLMRKNESDLVCESLIGLGLKNLKRIDAGDLFLHDTVVENGKILGPLTRITDPEEKRRIIGNLFVRVLEDACQGLALDFSDTFIAQGTLRPDLIESGNPEVSSYANRIKTHHNDVDLIRQARAGGRVIETNWDWHKDEVRSVARRLGIDEKIAGRQPFPGPGLGIRFICHEGTGSVSCEEAASFDSLLKSLDCQGAVVPIKTVGVQGDNRSYRYLAILNDPDTSWERLAELGRLIPNQLRFINRVACTIGSGSDADVQGLQGAQVCRMNLDREGIRLLRELDSLVREFLDKPPISQVFAVLLPLGLGGSGRVKGGKGKKRRSVAIRAFITNDYMTGRSAVIGRDIPEDDIFGLAHRIRRDFQEIDFIIYDLTGKPPATVEWE